MYLAYGAIAVALCAWIGVGFFAMLIRTRHAGYIDRMAEVVKQTELAADGARLHVLASGNLERSSKLDAIVASEVHVIIDTIRSVGTSAGVPVKISGALPASVPKGQKDMHAVAFVLESTGSFSSMMRVLALFDTLPLPSSIELVDLSREAAPPPPARPSQVWRLNLKLRVITTAAV